VVREVSRVEAIGSACGWSAAPVVSDGLVLLAGGSWGWPEATGGEAGDVPVLQALDAAGERFRLTWPASGREVEPGAVTIAPGGDIVLPVYEHDTSLQVLRLSPDGVVVARDELTDGDPYDIVAFDLASKLRVAVTPLGDQAYLCAWLYRQGRRLGTTYRQWGQRGYRWVSEEWPLFTGDGVVLGANGGRWVGRDLETGSVRWFTEAAGYQPVGAAAGAGAFIAIGLSAVERDRAPGPAGPHSVVLALDPRTGRALWDAPVEGLIRSAATGPGGVSVCAELADGARCLALVGNDGHVSATRRLDDAVATVFGPAPDGRPVRGGQDAAVVVAGSPDLTLVLLGTDRLAAFDQALAPVWTIPVDPPAFGHAARIADNRLTVVAAAIEGHRAYLRGQASLQLIEW
jgi:hypothetical protein